MSLHSQFPNIFTRYFYIFCITWLGIIFLGLFISIIFDFSINLISIPLQIKSFIWSFLIVSISTFAIYNQSGLPEIKNISIKAPKLSENMKIGYLSDVHIDGVHSINYLNKIIDILNKQKLDLVLINGDLVDGASFEKHSFKTLDRLNVPVYITLGNHESYIGNDFAKSLFTETKARVLENEVVNYKGLEILGIQDMFGIKNKQNEILLDKILSNMKWDSEKTSIMVLHEPIGSEIADKYGVNIQLAGHTHNGQIWPFNYVVKLVFPRVLGLYKIGNLSLYVGPGTGTWGPPMRLGSRNEITIITLEK
ncbi:MAG: metallophosphoesterase [Candidatus Gracilibacteria bacterium]|nr:metallophosphoesterase [Candidatus Gracilibacteria bacterium]MDD2908125.1 metallophosphoesterase [Candidatus Gracilibacteria bacterium]